MKIDYEKRGIMSGETGGNNASSQFLNTDRGKTKSNAIEVPSITLPKGGGALKGIDEKVSVNAVNGTASFSIPLPFAPARGASPALNLSYNSGFGNAVFGLGWALSLPSIKRKTDKGLPQYLDGEDSDTFLFSEAEDLVPEFLKNHDGSFSISTEGNYIIKENDSADGQFTIRYYRPRIEGLFARIERWSGKTSPEIKWRVITKENITTFFGWSAASRISDPEDDSRIFAWLPEFTFDDRGNCSRYIYKKENSQGLDDTLLHNRNRQAGGTITYTNLYLEKVLYGNRTPYRQFNDPFPNEADFMFQTVFDYGEYETNAPHVKSNDWAYRKDAFSDYKAGFEIRTTRLCRRILLFHHFSELPGGSALVKALSLQYDTGNQAGLAFLKTIISSGYIKKADGSYTCKNLPPLEFTYQELNWDSEIKNISPENLVHSPAGLAEPQYQLIDLFGEGLPGILSEQAQGWYYKRSLGDGNFEKARPVSPKPSFSGLGGQLHLMDLDADGGKQLVSYTAQPRGYFELDEAEIWQPFRTFTHLPNINMQDPCARLLDLNGDGRPDVLITEDNLFTWYESAGREGFAGARKTVKFFDEEAGPHLVFTDPIQTIFLADMSGDGLTDLVRIRNGEVCYWPNLGYGRFGAKVGMDSAPVFDHPDKFNPSFLRLADIDGSGTTDLIYLGNNRFSCWLNLSGNAFGTTPFEIDTFPAIHSQANITVADLPGQGTACIVWSSPLAKDAAAPLKYIDLMNGRKPHLMVAYKNNLGKEVLLEYTPSTRFYIEDKLAGRPWITKLHFPVHCLTKTETRDTVSGCRFVSLYRYHHGYYDHAEREFRGFGLVEQTDTEHFEHWVKGDAGNIVEEELHQAPVLGKSWFHTGAFLGRDKILSRFAREYWYEEMARQGFSAVNHELPLPDAHLVTAPGLSDSLIDHLSTEEWREALRACKGLKLRSEVFAKDSPLSGFTPEQLQKELTPYTVTGHNCVIELLQPRGQNRHAVFVVKESEAVTYSYERDPRDPRVAHNLNLKIDEYSNILEKATVVYPRLSADSALPAETQQAQGTATVIYTQNLYTNDIIEHDQYRLRLPSESRTYDLRGVAKAGTYYALSDFDNIPADATEVAYHESDAEPSPGSVQKRLIEHTRTTFYNSDLTGSLPLHRLAAIGLISENYQLAYTPDLLADIFGTKVNPALMLEGKFTHSEGDVDWWVRSGTIQYIDAARGETAADAQSRFYTPVSYTDPFGSKTRVRYEDNYYLFITETEDALGNKSCIDLFNYRTLSPQRVKDANENPAPVNIAAEKLGLTEKERELIVISRPNLSDQQLFWNAPSQWDTDPVMHGNVLAYMKRVDHFLDKTGLAYQEMVLLLSLKFIDPLKQLYIKHNYDDPSAANPTISADTAKKEIVNLDAAALDRIHRFLRLQKKTGWKYEVLDEIICQLRLGQGELTDDCLLKAADLVKLSEETGIKLAELIGFYGEIPHQVLNDEAPVPLYHQVFQNKARAGYLDEGLRPEKIDGSQLLSSLKTSISVCLQISEQDFDKLLPTLPDGSLSFANLSYLYAASRLMRKLKLKAEDLVILAQLTEAKIQDSPQATVAFVKSVRASQKFALKPADILFMLRHEAADLAARELQDEKIRQVLEKIQAGFQTAAWTVTGMRLPGNH
jgi:Insecticide toxin TcdB middle/C-terminal region./Salmonella virulence plasmid 65kDa B protein./Insecticide toxin TcdB middle/N-terminal region.